MIEACDYLLYLLYTLKKREQAGRQGQCQSQTEIAAPLQVLMSLTWHWVVQAKENNGRDPFLKPIEIDKVQQAIESFADQDVYLHLETTNGAYAAHRGESAITVGAYIRNGLIRFTSGKIVGSGPYRAGLQLPIGWVYAEGLTHWEIDHLGRLLLAGHDGEGKLAVALQLSHEPF